MGKSAGSWLIKTMLTLVLAGTFLPVQKVLAVDCVNNASTQYRSQATGNWGTPATWECSDDGTNWQTPTTNTPTSSNGAITIRTGHTVTIESTVTVDEVTVESGGQLTVGSGVAWTLANGSATPDLTISGILLNQGSTWTTTGTWAVGTGGTFIHNITSGISQPLNDATLDAGSFFIYRGPPSPAVSVANRNYGNLSFESTSETWSRTLSGGTATVQGDFTLGNGVTLGSSTFVGFTLYGDWTNNGTYNAGIDTVAFNGGATQTIGGATATAFNDLSISGLGSGAGSNSVVVLPVTNVPTVAGVVTNNGVFQQTQTLNNSSFHFANLSTDKYKGVEINTGANLGSTMVQIYGNQNTSGSTGTPVNRWYQIHPTNIGTADLTFHFLCDELQGSQTPANVKVWRYDGSAWAELGNHDNSGNSCESGPDGYVTVNDVTLNASEDTFVLKIFNPLAVNLETFSATPDLDAGQVRIVWETVNEVDNLGFYLYRSVAGSENWAQINTTLIPSQSPGSPWGFVYEWVDRDVVFGERYVYRLASMDMAGLAEVVDTVEAQYGVWWRVWMPLVGR